MHSILLVVTLEMYHVCITTSELRHSSRSELGERLRCSKTQWLEEKFLSFSHNSLKWAAQVSMWLCSVRPLGPALSAHHCLAPSRMCPLQGKWQTAATVTSKQRGRENPVQAIFFYATEAEVAHSTSVQYQEVSNMTIHCCNSDWETQSLAGNTNYLERREKCFRGTLEVWPSKHLCLFSSHT